MFIYYLLEAAILISLALSWTISQDFSILAALFVIILVVMMVRFGIPAKWKEQSPGLEVEQAQRKRFLTIILIVSQVFIAILTIIVSVAVHPSARVITLTILQAEVVAVSLVFIVSIGWYLGNYISSRNKPCNQDRNQQMPSSINPP